MQLPSAADAIIDPVKLHGYLLSPVHPIGRFKARFFAALGFTADNWHDLEHAIRDQHLSQNAEPSDVASYGQFFTIRAMLKGPLDGATVVSVWLVRTGETAPRFVTAYPGGEQ